MFQRAASTLLRTQSARVTSALSRQTQTPGIIGAVRNLNVHEHVSMELFEENGIATPKGIVAVTPEEAEAAYKDMGNRK